MHFTSKTNDTMLRFIGIPMVLELKFLVGRKAKSFKISLDRGPGCLVRLGVDELMAMTDKHIGELADHLE